MDFQTSETGYNEGSNLAYRPTSDERTMAILAHILTFVAPVIATLIVYILKKDESKYVSDHAKEALNFQITIMIVTIGLCITLIGIFLVFFVAIWYFVLVIIATIKASDNKLYRYPLTIRFIK